MVCVTGDAYIVVEVDAQQSHEALRGILLALVSELLRTLAQIGVENALQTVLPCVRNLLCLVLGYSVNVWLKD